MSALPWVRFFPTDWQSEQTLRVVSLAAKGLWIEMLCCMAKNEPRGYLTLNGGVNPTVIQIARLVGHSEAEITPLLEELRQAGTFSVDPKGVIFSRRMVKDTSAYNNAVLAGKSGGNPKLRKKRDKTGVNPPINLNMASGIMDSGDLASESDSEAIFDAYPRKDKRDYAIKCIEKALKIKGITPDFLLERTILFAEAQRNSMRETKFIPYASTWFNQRVFNDDPATWIKVNGSSTPTSAESFDDAMRRASAPL